jgi:hypothetical protein
MVESHLAGPDAVGPGEDQVGIISVICSGGLRRGKKKILAPRSIYQVRWAVQAPAQRWSPE